MTFHVAVIYGLSVLFVIVVLPLSGSLIYDVLLQTKYIKETVILN